MSGPAPDDTEDITIHSARHAMAPDSSTPNLRDLNRRFRVDWELRLNGILGPISVPLTAWCVASAEHPLGAFLAAVAYSLMHISASHPKVADRIPMVSHHFRALSNIITLFLLALAVGPTPAAWLMGLLAMIGAAFSEQRWHARYLQFTAMFALLVGMHLGGVHPRALVTSIGALLVVAIAVETIYNALRRAVVAGLQREREVALVNAQLQAALDARKTFLATMSHEIRTPMNGVLGMAELLDGTELSAEQKEMVGVVRSSGHGLLQVLNDILDLSKLEAGRVEPEKVPFRPARLVKDVVELLRHGDLSPGVELRYVLDNVPSRVIGDPTRFRQVLLNLVGNAVKFTQQGHIEVRVARRGEQLVVAVEDTGAGIDPTRLKQLFQPFIQGDATTTRTHGGTGLGLAIAQRLVNLMGGTITVESALGSGSTFRFEVDAPTAPTDATEISPGGLTLKGEHHQLHADVLLVDDNPINLAVAEAMLVRLGCTVTALDNAPEALRTTASHTFDVVLMDCQMPVMDGFEATIALREQGYQQPVIALTAGVTMEERQRCMESGMNAVIAKPATLSSLREALLRWASTETPDDKPAAAPPGDVPPLHP